MPTLESVTHDVYRDAALTPDVGLCCTTTPVWKLPGLNIPEKMLSMNYGCGSTVHPRDLDNDPTVLYVGIGGGMELLQFSYFSRRADSVIGLDVVDEMLDVCHQNLEHAQKLNPWFKRDFILLRKGDALSLPIEDESIDVASQNCLFNIFRTEDVKQAVSEMYRVLKPHGRLVMSDPICEQQMPETLRNDERLRALCLSGAMPLTQYVKVLTDAGFGTIEIRARRPYRVLDPQRYDCEENILIESIEIAAIKDPMPNDGPCVFTGKTAIYFGSNDFFDDRKGHVILKDQPMAVCDKTANDLNALMRDDLLITDSTWHYDGGGCC